MTLFTLYDAQNVTLISHNYGYGNFDILKYKYWTVLQMDKNEIDYAPENKERIVLIDKKLYGIAFIKESTTAEFILNQLDLMI